jgi:hypothetical protein
MAVPMIGAAQGTPTSNELPATDRLWGGTYVDRLPNCDAIDDEPLCLVLLTQSDRGDEYYYGVIQNVSDRFVTVHTVAVTIRDSAGDIAAVGDSVNESPSEISPGGHGLIMVTVAGEYLADFTAEARFDYTMGLAHDGFGVPVQVDSAQVRGEGIVGEITNTGRIDYPVIYLHSICFDASGGAYYWGQSDALRGPIAIGETVAFAIPIYDHDCDDFVVVAWGNPYA